MTVSQEARQSALVRIEGLSVEFGSGNSVNRALDDVTLSVPDGTSLGIVGESGSGKSTLAKVLVGVNPIAAGRVVIDGTQRGAGDRSRPLDSRLIQLIPQDPYGSLDPRRTAGEALAEALDPRRARVRTHRATIDEWLDRVQLASGSADKYPHEFSGGQRQRIAIARALCLRPRVVIADEITSALDVSVQAEVLELLAELREELALTMLFISHNLAVVRHVSDRVAVLYHGRLVEEGDVDDVFTRPREEYTRSLLEAVPGGPRFSVRGEPSLAGPTEAKEYQQ
jgi:ABC-type dipeptide/oligopeptide/nickel transport system ATPase subunit